MIELFNKELTQLSHKLTSRRLLSEQLQQNRTLVFQALKTRDQSAKGYYTHSEVVSLWIEKRLAPSPAVFNYLALTFPFPEISYSAYFNQYKVYSISLWALRYFRNNQRV